MDFNEFTQTIADSIQDYLLQYDIEKVQLEKVLKNNGIICTGLVICEKGENISPNIYLDYYYSLYRQNSDIEAICRNISSEYSTARTMIKGKLHVDLGFDNVKDKLFIKLINYERNEELLQDCPYIPLFNLAVTFRYLVQRDDEGIASAMVKHSDLKNWGLSIDELYILAKDNTRKLFPAVIRRLDEMLVETGQREAEDCVDLPLYILTNNRCINGAAYLAYDDVISDFAHQINSSLFILPSSIHELLLLPAPDDGDKGYLNEMVQDINKFVVSDFDYLSDCVYYYDIKNGCIRI